MAHVTIAASERAFQMLFAALRDNFQFEKSDSASFGAFTVSYHAKAHLEEGTVDLRGDNSVQIKELDLDWDILDFSLGIDIPSVCVGGFCIIPTPFGCALRAPKICVFEDNPDIDITLSLASFLESELSVTARLLTKYDVNPARPAGMNDWDAQDASPSLANHWQLFLDPISIDFDVLDFADIAGDLLDDALNAAVDNLLGFLPGWAKTVIKAIFGPLIDFVRDVLDLPDDIGEWIADVLGVSFGLFNLILQLIAEYLASRYPLHQIEDPFPILPAVANPNPFASGVLVPVKIPIRDLKVFNTDAEMILEGNVG